MTVISSINCNVLLLKHATHNTVNHAPANQGKPVTDADTTDIILTATLTITRTTGMHIGHVLLNITGMLKR